MSTAKINLTNAENALLQALAQQTGQPAEELLHEAVALYLARRTEQDRRAILRKACGMWKDRTDLPDLRELRKRMGSDLDD